MSREVPIAATPFTIVLNETVTKQTPVAGSAQVNQSVATQGPIISLIT